MLSSFYLNKMKSKTGKSTPMMINEYCKYLGEVDGFDQTITYYRYPHLFNK